MASPHQPPTNWRASDDVDAPRHRKRLADLEQLAAAQNLVLRELHRPGWTAGVGQIAAALREANSAITPRRRRDALAAVVAAQRELEHRKRDAPAVELAAHLAGRSYSDARVRHLESQLEAARVRLEHETEMENL